MKSGVSLIKVWSVLDESIVEYWFFIDTIQKQPGKISKLRHLRKLAQITCKQVDAIVSNTRHDKVTINDDG